MGDEASDAAVVRSNQHLFLGDATSPNDILAKCHTLEDLDQLIREGNRLLDDVETQLVEEVSRNADSFFEASSALSRLVDTTASIQDSVASFAADLSRLSSSQGSEYDRLSQLSVMQETLAGADAILDDMHAIIKGQESIKDMLETHSFSDALQLVEEKMAIVRRISGVVSFKCIETELLELQVALSKLLSQGPSSDP